MTISLNKILDDIIRREGGFVNDPADRGGPTKFGITQKTLSDYLNRPASIEDVRNITEELAKEIFATNYFFAPRLNAAPEMAQPFLLDSAVHHGPGNAVEFMQQVVNKSGFGPLALDGVFGPKTQKSARDSAGKIGQDYFVNALVDERLIFMWIIVERNPSQKRFLRGWLRRAASFWMDIPGLKHPKTRQEYKQWLS